MTVHVTRADVLRFRFRAHQLDRDPGRAADPADVALLDYGVQDTGPDGAAWALAVRGLEGAWSHDLALAWTLRGAPHAYRRADLGPVAVATSPFSEGDAAKRIFDAAKPLRDAGIAALDALATVAGHLRELAARPIAKGDASGRLTGLLDEPYLRWCRPCQATHIYEQPFRLAALQAGLDLEPGTSPPVLRRVKGLKPARFGRSGGDAEARFHVVRNYLRFYGPARVRDVAAFLDSTVEDVRAQWPGDVVQVAVAGEDGDRRRSPRFLLAGDVDALTAAGGGSGPEAGQVRLLGPYDPYLQLRDRELLVADEARRKDLWRVLGRPGAVVVGGEVAGTWRPRSSGRKLRVEVDRWADLSPATEAGIGEEAARLAAHRGVAFVGMAT